MDYKKLLRFFLGIPLTTVAFIFIGKIFYDSREEVIQTLSSIKPEVFAIGIFFYAIFFTIKSFAWIEILKSRGHSVNIRKTIFDYSFAEIKRYIPGSIFAFAGRISSHDTIPKKETLKGIGIEAIILLAAAFIGSLPAIYFLTQLFYAHLIVALNLFFVLVATAIVSLFFWKNNVFKKIFVYFNAFLLLVLAWFFYGLGSLFILISISPTDPNYIATIASFFILSWAGGYLLFVTPMGLGARELVAVFGLSFFVATPIATVAAVITRLSMIVGEVLFIVFVTAFKRLTSDSKILRINPYHVILIFAAIAYFTFFSYYSLTKHDRFLTGRFDLGNMAQTVWNTYHGRFFELTNPDGVNNMSRLGVHSDILLAFLAPLYFIWEDPKMLLLFQTFSLSIAGIFVYLIAKHILKKEFIALAFSISFYLNFWIHEQNLFDFHAVSIATLFLLACFYFLIKRKLVLFFTFLALALTTKENVFLVAIFFGVYFLLRKKWALGSLLTFLPLIAFYFLISHFIPNARGEAHFALGGYEYLGSSAIDIIINSIKNPLPVIDQLANLSTFEYLKSHFISTGYIAILSPFYLLFTLPDMAIYLLSSNFGYRSYHYHFGAVIVPFFYIASIYSVKKILSSKLKFSHRVLGLYVLFFAIFSVYNYSPIPGMKNGDVAPYKIKDHKKITYYLTFIPPNADIAASNSIGAHLSHRENIYVVPHGINDATYVAFFNEKDEITSLLDQTKYETLIQDKDLNFYLYKKKYNLACSFCKP